ncbi:hypothetical protein H0H93_013478, partial [Arthromyces matolae]
PAVLNPPNPDAGGRPSNGLVWIENLANSIGATLKDFAVPGAVVYADQYPAGSVPSDLVSQINLYTQQVYTSKPNPNTTLYTIFLGINDVVRGGNLDLCAQEIAYEILVLASSPIFARNFLIVDNYGRGTKTPAGEAYKQELFSMIPALRKYGYNVGFIDLSTIWNGVLGASPGYQSFGYTNPGTCTVSNTTTVGACSSPSTYFYWLQG